MYIQSTFSNATEVLIRQKFNISNEERLISAVWLSINRTGFVFTDRNCYWNVKATIQKDDNKSTLPKITSISNKNAQDMQVNLNFKRKSHKQKEKLNAFFSKPDTLVLNNYMGQITFSVSSLDIDDALKLRKIFIDYATCGHYSYENKKQISLEYLFFSICVFFDYIKVFATKKDSSSSLPLKKEDKNVSALKDYFSSRSKQRISRSFFIQALITYIGDVAADLIFAALIFLSAKPVLLYKKIYFKRTSFSNLLDRMASIFFYDNSKIYSVLSGMEIKTEIIDSLLYRRNYIFTILLTIFLITKVAVIVFSCRGKKKIFPLLLLIPLLASCFLLPTHFLLFFIFIILLYFLMQFALGFLWSAIKYKVFALLVLVFMEYYFLHLFLYPNFISVMAAVLQILSFHAAW